MRSIRGRRSRSQALVEFALAISIFMLLVLGTFDLARAYLAYTVVTNAAREAGRYGAAHVGESGWQTAAAQAGVNLAIGVDTDPAVLKLTVGTQPLDALQYITVTGTYQFRSVTPMVGALLGNPITIQVDTWQLAG
ncbi:MAG TPA: TadE family protein [Chloroflexota bacterium]|jgi:Flp pilus assembly protein TadG|nr:TadE family protein [Chloroflexota bacterium]